MPVGLDQLRTPCCRRPLALDSAIAAAEWAANDAQEGVQYWVYLHCSFCGEAIWFGTDNGQGKGYFGIFGASPIADLIPIYELRDMPKFEFSPRGLIAQWHGPRKKIHGDRRYWTTPPETNR